MKKAFIVILLYVFLFPPLKAEQIIDKGKFFSKKDIKLIEEQIASIENKTGLDIFIYTTQNCKGEEPKDYGMNLFYKYPIGKKGINNGLLILLAKDEKRAEYLNGYGIEWILSDSVSTNIMNEMIPFFKKNDFTNGIIKALELTEAQFPDNNWETEATDLSQIKEGDTSKVLKFAYTNTSREKFTAPLKDSVQFSEGYYIHIKSGKHSFKLYYTKYMSDLITDILKRSDIIIYVRLVDWENKKLELLGIE